MLRKLEEKYPGLPGIKPVVGSAGGFCSNTKPPTINQAIAKGFSAKSASLDGRRSQTLPMINLRQPRFWRTAWMPARC